MRTFVQLEAFTLDGNSSFKTPNEHFYYKTTYNKSQEFYNYIFYCEVFMF